MVKILLALLVATTASAQLTDTTRQEIYHKNIITNPGFENGKAGWSASGGDTFTLVSSTTKKHLGKSYVTWDSAGASRIFTHSAVTVDAALAGTNGLCEYRLSVPSGTATHLIRVYDGTNVLVSNTITSSSTTTTQQLNFIFPSSGTVQCQLVSVAADEPSLSIYEAHMGRAGNLTNVSQATFIGSAYFPATSNCTFTVTSATFAALTDSDCPGPTVELNPGPGTIQTTDANATTVTVNSLPPGIYKVSFRGGVFTGSANPTNALAISDGTNTRGQTSVGDVATAVDSFNVEGYFSYDSPANRSFTLQCATSTGSCNIANNAAERRLQFSIERFPLTSEMAYRPDMVIDPIGTVITVAGTSCPENTLYADGTAVSRTTYAELFQKMGVIHGYGDNSTTFNLPDYRGRFLRGQDGGTGRDEDASTRSAMNTGGQAGDNVGSVQTDAFQGHYHSMSNNTSYLRSGAGSYQILNASSATLSDSPSVTAPTTDGTNGTPRTAKETHPDNANVRYCVVAKGRINAPVFVGSVTAGGNSSSGGAWRQEWGTFYTTSEGSACTASPCTLAKNSNGVSSVTRATNGDYTINFSPAFAAAPVCLFIPVGTYRIFTDYGTATTTTFRLLTSTGTIASPTATDSAVAFMCSGQR
jgi:microcystin-dependent protein